MRSCVGIVETSKKDQFDITNQIEVLVIAINDLSKEYEGTINVGAEARRDIEKSSSFFSNSGMRLKISALAIVVKRFIRFTQLKIIKEMEKEFQTLN